MPTVKPLNTVLITEYPKLIYTTKKDFLAEIFFNLINTMFLDIHRLREA